jgi:hypothetical protein
MLHKGLTWRKQLVTVTNICRGTFGELGNWHWVCTVAVRPVVTCAAAVWWPGVKFKTRQLQRLQLGSSLDSPHCSCLGRNLRTTAAINGNTSLKDTDTREKNQPILQTGTDIAGNETADQLATLDPNVLSQDLNHHAAVGQDLPRRLSGTGQRSQKIPGVLNRTQICKGIPARTLCARRTTELLKLHRNQLRRVTGLLNRTLSHLC